jgi:hypothetical protein
MTQDERERRWMRGWRVLQTSGKWEEYERERLWMRVLQTTAHLQLTPAQLQVLEKIIRFGKPA